MVYTIQWPSLEHYFFLIPVSLIRHDQCEASEGNTGPIRVPQSCRAIIAVIPPVSGSGWYSQFSHITRPRVNIYPGQHLTEYYVITQILQLMPALGFSVSDPPRIHMFHFIVKQKAQMYRHTMNMSQGSTLLTESLFIHFNLMYGWVIF